jgi:hypothetical protein
MKGEVEDWLTDLPPIDGAEDETDEPSTDTDDLLPEEGADSSLDDKNADDLEIGDSIDIDESEAAEGTDDEGWEADTGEAQLDTASDEEPWTDADGEGADSGDDELDFDDEDEENEDDRGEEGTADPVEYSIDEELPALDADADGDFEDALLAELRLDGGAPARFADPVWEATSVSAWTLLEEDDDDIVAMLAQVAPHLLVALTSSGNVLMPSDGRHAAARVASVPDDVKGERLFVACSGIHPVLWIANGRGALIKSADLGQTWEPCAGPGRPILALAAHEDGSLSALAESACAAELLTSRDGVRWFAQHVGVELSAKSAGGRIWLCHRGGATAIGEPSGVWVSRDGAAFARIADSAASSAGVFAGTTSQVPLLFVTGPADDRGVHLIRAARAEAPEIVVELEPRGLSGEGGVLAVAWDEAEGAARLAFATEIVAVKPRTPYLS